MPERLRFGQLDMFRIVPHAGCQSKLEPMPRLASEQRLIYHAQGWRKHEQLREQEDSFLGPMPTRKSAARAVGREVISPLAMSHSESLILDSWKSG